MATLRITIKERKDGSVEVKAAPPDKECTPREAKVLKSLVEAAEEASLPPPPKVDPGAYPIREESLLERDLRVARMVVD